MTDRPGTRFPRSEKGGVVPDHLLLEEFHLTMTISRTVPDDAREAIRRTLNSREFQAALRKAARDCVHSFPALARVRLTVAP